MARAKLWKHKVTFLYLLTEPVIATKRSLLKAPFQTALLTFVTHRALPPRTQALPRRFKPPPFAQMLYLLRSKLRLCYTFFSYHQSDIIIGLLKIICVNTYKIILHVTTLKFFQPTQHSIFLLTYYYSVDLIKMALSSEESRATSGASSTHVERTHLAEGSSASAEQRCSPCG